MSRIPPIAGHLVLALMLGWPPAHAAETPSRENENEDTSSESDPLSSGVVERVTVEAPADRTPLLDRTTFSTVLLREDLDRDRLSLTEALRRVPGVRVQAFGGLGEFATVSIRGSSSEQVEIFVDGVAQRSAVGGGVNLADLPSLALERIEIYRGFTPAWFGPSSLAGAISVTTRSPDQPATEIRASYGSFDSVSYGGLIAHPAGSWNLLGSLEISHSEGDFGFFGTDHPQRRENNENDSLRLLGRASRPLNGEGAVKKIEITNSLLIRDQGVPGLQSQQDPDATFDLFRDTLQVGASLSSPWGGWSADPALYATYETQHFARPTRSPATDAENRFTTIGLRSPLQLHPTAGTRLIISPEVRHERVRGRDKEALTVNRFKAGRDSYFLSAGIEWETAGDRLLVAPSLRWTSLDSTFDGLKTGEIRTRSQTSEKELSGKLGLRWSITSRLALRANAGSFFREPSLTELYGNTGVIQGNPDLRAERGDHADAGLSWSWLPTSISAGQHARAASLEGSVFFTRADELILLSPAGGQTVKPRNSGEARITGVELSGNLLMRGGWRFDLTYSHQRAEDKSGVVGIDGKILPGRPAAELHAGIYLRRVRWSGLYRYLFLGDNYLIPENTGSVPDRHLHTVGVGFTPVPAWELSLEVENVGDQRAGDLAGFPLPGRMVIVEVRFRP
ncbi:MAG: TonB-dependent receptor [Acidobacteria bacterium]|nr:TonB-dependent receptor [Acidobacteriota bacterium]